MFILMFISFQKQKKLKTINYAPSRETFPRQTTTKKEKPRTALSIRFYGIAIGLPCNDTNLMHAVLGQLKELRTGSSVL